MEFVVSSIAEDRRLSSLGLCLSAADTGDGDDDDKKKQDWKRNIRAVNLNTDCGPSTSSCQKTGIQNAVQKGRLLFGHSQKAPAGAEATTMFKGQISLVLQFRSI